MCGQVLTLLEGWTPIYIIEYERDLPFNSLAIYENKPSYKNSLQK